MEIRVEGDIEKALKLLKRKLQKEGVLKELKKRRYYEKPSVKLKTKQREAQKKRAKGGKSGKPRPMASADRS
ncbi:MAG: 30S ribosomal protein S21 [Actinomycetota bacterium]|nr:30S ribosomal protein S21 [Actinomycetota bacterium]MDA8173478.1 30S ribosomal protein S21 [Nitrospiraceae bacterium]